ncbi:MAG TPA: hypothetical protein VKA13_03725 [Gammaproteobacteria bacterium]|nr:hypothetical protein [Gammaproteobacteria bacterium]
MADNKKQIISLRMNTSDLRKVKDLARRLRVRESDVFRFAIRSTLRKLSPLHDSTANGSDLIPVLIEYGPELMSYFELDSLQLESLVNDDVREPDRKIDRSDIDLLAMAGLQDHYLTLKLMEVSGAVAEPQGTSSLLKEYLYKKYVSRQDRKEV